MDDNTEPDAESGTFRISDEVAEMVRVAVGTHAQGDRIGWDVSAPMQDTIGGIPQFVLGLTMVMPMASLGEYAMVSTTLALIGSGPEDITQVVHTMIEQLRNQRTERLREELASTNGAGARPTTS